MKRREPRSLRARALALLARRDHSRAELRAKLLRGRADDEAVARAGYTAGHDGNQARERHDLHHGQGPHDRHDPDGDPQAALDALLDELAQLGYLSDERYARSVVARRSASHSRRAIAVGLKARGVAGDAVQCALDESDADDVTTMRMLWQRRFGTPPIDDRERARHVRFLHSRGFALSMILRFLRDLAASSGRGPAA